MLLVASSTVAGSTIYDDGRDPHVLFSPKLLNRQLHLQLAEPEEAGRLSHVLDSEWFTFAADLTAGTELPPRQQTRFHGFSVLDSYVQLRPFDGVELNLNLVLVNVSASDGYRFSTYILPGVSVHLFTELFDLGDAPLSIEFLGPDLDLVTLGKGLLLEQIALEGEKISLRWNDFELRHVFGGRVLWFDNLNTVGLDYLQGSLGLLYSIWFSDGFIQGTGEDPLPGVFRPFGDREGYISHHLGIYGAYELLEGLTLTGEYSARFFDGAPKSGLLLRADWSGELLEDLRVHLGYQFRFYQRGFGPNTNLNETSTAPILPYREGIYATNSFEYFGVSKYFELWSHSVMAEFEYRIWDHYSIVGSLEYFSRSAAATKDGPKVVYDRRFGERQRLPGTHDITYYRTGLEIYPWAKERHHISALFTNKLVVLSLRPNDAAADLFAPRPLLLLLVEVEL